MTIEGNSAGETATNLPATLQAVERASADLRRGGIIVLAGDGQALLVQAAEMASRHSLARLRALSGSGASLAVTGQRAQVLGFDEGVNGVVSISLAGGVTDEAVRQLANPAAPAPQLAPIAVQRVAPKDLITGAVEATKLARLLPAAVVATVPVDRLSYLSAWANAEGLLIVEIDNMRDYRAVEARNLRFVGEARVPLGDAQDARVVAFRPGDGGKEHLAIVVGDLDPTLPALTRLHSECFTGDLLGSLRCDCGDQLRGAVAAICEAGSGVLIYLAQEGRGIGLVNKLRAYALQDSGFDTVRANEQLGFDDDERIYLPAVEILQHLGINRVRLMTNNPAKIDALGRFGIEVTERVAHAFPANEFNAEYLKTKQSRLGHLL